MSAKPAVDDIEQMLAESGLGKRLAEAEAMALRLAASDKARADALAHLRRVPIEDAVAVCEGRKNFDPAWADDGGEPRGRVQDT